MARSLLVIGLHKNFCREFGGLILRQRGKILSPGPVVEHAPTSRAQAALCRLRAEYRFCHDFSALSQCNRQPEEMQAGSHRHRKEQETMLERPVAALHPMSASRILAHKYVVSSEKQRESEPLSIERCLAGISGWVKMSEPPISGSFPNLGHFFSKSTCFSYSIYE